MFIHRLCHLDGSASSNPKTRAYARFTHSGCYSTTITRPALFRPYLEEQLTLLYQDYGAHISVEPSLHEIPYPYVIDGSALTLDRSMSAGLTRHFPTTELSQIGDETADGIYHPAEFSPLSHFDARRVDFSLARLRHYTGTPAEHFQPFVLFTNYTRYVDEFVRWGCSQILDPDSPYIALFLRGRDMDHRRNRSTGRGHLRPGVEKAPDASLAPDHRRRSGHYAD